MRKFDGCKARRKGLTPDDGVGPVSLMGPIGLFYANAVGTFGAVSPGRNWDSPASAAHLWALALVDSEEIYSPCARMTL